jgi:WD40 repeat protein/uncharacterized caspase-like protein
MLTTFACVEAFIVDAQSRPKTNSQPVENAANLVVQLGHSDVIRSVAISTDGRFVVTGSRDRTACIWEAATGRQIRTLKGHTDEISSVAFSLNGHYVLTGSYDRTARLWETETGREVRRFEGFSDRVRTIALTPNSLFILIALDDSSVQVLNVATGKPVDSYSSNEDTEKLVAFSKDGRFVLTGEKETKLLDAETGSLIRNYKHDLSLKGALVFSRDGRFILARGPTPTSIQLWSAETGELVRDYNLILEGPGNLVESSTVHSLAFSPDGRFIVAGGDFYDVWIKDTETGTDVRRFGMASFRGPVSDVAFTLDGRSVLAVGGSRERSTLEYHTGGNNGGSGFLFDANTGNEVLRFEGRADRVGSATYSPDGRYILVGNAHGKAILWDQLSGNKVRQFEGHTDYVGGVAFSNDGRRVLTGSDDGSARSWDIETGRELQRFENDGNSTVTSVAFSPDGKFVVVGSIHYARLFEADTGRALTWYGAAGAAVNAVAFGRKYVLTGDNSGLTQIWDIETGREVRRLGEGEYSGGVYALAFSPDESFILAVGQNRFARIWETESGREILRFDPNSDPKSTAQFSRIYAVAFSSDGRFVLTGGEDSIVRLWSVETGKEMRRFEGHTGEIQSVRFSPDGNQVLIVAADNTVRIWNTSSGHEICRLISLRDGDWVVVDPVGRFDAGNLEEIEGLSWIMSDDPMTPLPVEFLMRDYYEPRLLPRLIKCNEEKNCDDELKRVRDVSKLNRAQPRVKISNISVANEERYAYITVEVGRGESKHTNDGKETTRTTGVYDVRLFRDGQLVGNWPRERAEKLIQGTSKYVELSEKLTDENRLLEILRSWQVSTEVTRHDAIKFDQKTGAMTLPSIRVALPRGKDVSQIEFSAYAFNDDRIKSQTARWEWPADILSKLPKAQVGKPRAYIIAVGVNAYENSDFDLDFAADDARRMAAVVTEKLIATVQYEKVVPITLISDYEVSESQRIVTEKQATKERFHAALDLLAGKSVDPRMVADVKNANQLQKATPDDLVLIMYYSHGYADRAGNFYLIPYDTGLGIGKVFTSSVSQHSISSDELSLWLRDVDAGEMILIVDACHSSAAIEGSEFKPGPMGSRGLGQLSYDKGMKILTATQADNIALENNLLKHGLLTYALVRDGIEARQADYKPEDNVINIGEWLSYGVDRVPKLYEEVKAGKIQDFGITNARATKVVIATQSGKTSSRALEEVVIAAKAQQPSLFDFNKKRRDVVLLR